MTIEVARTLLIQGDLKLLLESHHDLDLRARADKCSTVSSSTSMARTERSTAQDTVSAHSHARRGAVAHRVQRVGAEVDKLGGGRNLQDWAGTGGRVSWAIAYVLVA